MDVAEHLDDAGLVELDGTRLATRKAPRLKVRARESEKTL
jgi:hypothetical protein